MSVHTNDHAAYLQEATRLRAAVGNNCCHFLPIDDCSDAHLTQGIKQTPLTVLAGACHVELVLETTYVSQQLQMRHAAASHGTFRLLLPLLLLLLLSTSVSVHCHAQLGLQQQHAVQWQMHHMKLQHLHSRRLLQSRWAAGKSINRLNAISATRIDPNAPLRLTAQAGSGLGISPVGLSTAVTGGGAAKGSYSIHSASSNTTARTAAEDRSTAAVGVARRATVRSGLDTLVMAQQQLQQRAQPGGNSSSSSGSNNGGGGPDNAPPPTPAPPEPKLFDVLMATSSDYSVAGDRSSVLLKEDVPTPGLPRRKPNSRRIYGLDYDYGAGVWTGGFADAFTAQHSALENATRRCGTVDTEQKRRADGRPGSHPTCTRHNTHTHTVVLHACRASVGGTTGAVTVFPGATARSHATASSLRGLISARDTTGDIFKNNLTSAVVATPPVMLQHAGADAAVIANARSYKASLRPSVAVVGAQAGSGVSEGGSSSGGKSGKRSGASSSIYSYVAGLMTVNTQAQSAALGGCLQGLAWIPC